jgi:asparagine synthase (glutamine-hydrolysing)
LQERVRAAGPIEIGTRDAIAECRRRLGEVVDLRLRADVPVAATLSGGVDSSVLAALARRRCGPIVAYCFGHPDVRSTEASVAAVTGRFASIETRWVYPSAREMAEAFWATLDAQDSPFSTLAIAGQYAVYEAARRDGQKVLVGGQGGDEVFLGYRKALLWAVAESMAGGGWWGTSRAAANAARAGAAEWRHLPLFARHVAARGSRSSRRPGSPSRRQSEVEGRTSGAG